MEREPQRRERKKDRTGVFISTALHVLIVGLIAYLVSKTELGRQIIERTIGSTREKKVEDKPKPPPAKAIPKDRLKPPPGAPPLPARRAADAPPPVGESFMSDTRKKDTGPSAGADSEQKKTEAKIIVVPPPPKPAMKAAGATTIKQLYAERAKEAAAVEAIGSEQISKSGGSDAGDVVSKIGGTVLVEGKFAVIRGLSDRYVTTTLNGAEIPSPDPYRRAASLDMFPAQVISKVSVSKTFTPDQQGSYTGGGIDIVTKSFPEKPFVSASIGAGYNTQTTHNDSYLTYEGGNLDWAGMDDGTRELPEELAQKTLLVPPLVFSIGRPGTPQFAKGVARAERLKALGTSAGYAQFAPDREAPPFNHNFTLAAGETTHFLGKPLGIFVGVNYRREYSFFEDAISRRFQQNFLKKTLEIKSDFSDTRAVTEVNWAAMASLAYQLHENHQIGFNYLRNQNSEDVVRLQVGEQISDPDGIFVQNRLHFTERSLETFQLKGSHSFPELGHLRADWLGALSKTAQDEPDVRFLNYAIKPPAYLLNLASTPEPRSPTRYFRNLEENNSNLKLDLGLPFWQWTMDEGEMKIGFWDSASQRNYFDRELYYLDGVATPPFDGDGNSILVSTNLGYTLRTNRNGTVSVDAKRYLQVRTSFYSGDYNIRAGYWMVDTPIVSKLRVIGGLRIETTDIKINSVSYQASPLTGKTTNSTELSEASLLPAAALVFSVTSNMNVRASYSQTLARPSFRELASVRSYDPILDEILEGNPLLEMIESENYDARWEWFFRPGELLSIGAFYKQIKNAIEKRFVTQDQDIVTFGNRPEATVFGVEFEARKNLGFIGPGFDYFNLGGNLTLIKSEVDLTPDELKNKRDIDPSVSPSRPMYDQSPYIINLDLTYDNPRSGTSLSLVYALAGPRITIAAITTDDIYEQPAPSLDFIFSQRLGRNLAFKFAVKNILNPEIERTYGEDGKNKPALDLNGRPIADRMYTSYRRGLSFSVGLSYDF